MREILFRGKRIDNGEWVEGYLFDDGIIDSRRKFVGEIVIEDYKGSADDLYCITGSCFYEVDPETVGQYTGYKDDTGKRIFEGNIVAFEDMTSTESGYSEMDCCGTVGYDEKEACFYVTDRLSSESWEVLDECHIVGNIFDNPELLNGD